MAIDRHDEVLAGGIREHNGAVLKERGEGDSFFAVFARASDAVAAACGIQRALHTEPWPDGLSIRVRMAIHTGEAYEEAGDYRGEVINRCARLRAVAHGGQVLISTSVRELAQDNLPEHVWLKDLGEHRLRDLDRPERIFRVVDPDLPVPELAGRRTWFQRWTGPLALAAAVLLGLVALAIAASNKGVQSGPLITTVAGTGTRGSSGDGGKATSAELVRPAGVALDKVGNLYIVDSNSIRQVSLDGTIRRVAGTGIPGDSGDGGSATLAQLNIPAPLRDYGTASQVAFDDTGNMYIDDLFNQKIRKVTPGPAGTISTVAGNGSAGYSGDGGPAISAQLNSPRGVVIDGRGDLYIADTENNCIRRVDAATGVITTFAGTGQPGFFGDNGPASAAQLNAPQGLALDPEGDLYIADAVNNRIRRVDTTGMITTVAGDGVADYSGDGRAATTAGLNLPSAVAVGRTGIIYIADTENQRVRQVDLTGTITTLAGTGGRGYSGDGSTARLAQLALPLGITVDSSGAIYVADSANNVIRKIH